MSKPKAICVRELWTSLTPDEYIKMKDGAKVIVMDNRRYKPFNQPIHTAPVYLHEWWVKESDNTTELLQMAEQARECGHLDLADEYETKAKIIREVMNNVHRWTQGATGYQIAPDTITTESEGEDE